MAEDVYRKLLDAGLDALLDDRDERPGVKFKDADLIGFPLRVAVGAKSLANGQIEWSFRKDRAKQLGAPAEVIERVVSEVRSRRI
jgi:prolyl-tRNA synthetase